MQWSAFWFQPLSQLTKHNCFTSNAAHNHAEVKPAIWSSIGGSFKPATKNWREVTSMSILDLLWHEQRQRAWYWYQPCSSSSSMWPTTFYSACISFFFSTSIVISFIFTQIEAYRHRKARQLWSKARELHSKRRSQIQEGSQWRSY